jgi:hypothetical protein
MKKTTHTHTPGPWHYAPGELVYGPLGETVASCRFVTNFKDTNVANMRLVAAAPELLAALQLVYANAGESPEWIRARIGSVISKAEGVK